jgi:hypothetical protein
MDRPGCWSRRAALALLGLGAGGCALGLPLAARAQSPEIDRSKDFSREGTTRRDTQVVRPKDGETVTVRLPKQGTALIASQIPWAVTGGKETPELEVEYDVRGIRVHHLGTGQAKISFNLRLLDGRKITVNVRTANTKYNVGYVIIT